MNDISSVLLDGLLRFGKYPTDEDVQLLKNNGYSIFIDLCERKDVHTPYNTEGLFYNNIPIKDCTADIGDRKYYEELIEKVQAPMRNGYKVYVHCMGGHGRSAMISAIIYGKLTGTTGQTALREVYQAHQRRGSMKSKYRKMGAPQTDSQKAFVLNELGSESNENTEETIYFYEGFMSNFYKSKITIDGIEYSTSEHYFQAQKFIYPGASQRSIEYGMLVASQSTPNKSKILANQKTGGGYKWRTQLNDIINSYPDVKMRSDWEQIKDDVMRNALYYKFTQNPALRQQLKDTGNKKLVEHTKRDKYWGDGGDGSGLNKLGQLLMELRSQIL